MVLLAFALRAPMLAQSGWSVTLWTTGQEVNVNTLAHVIATANRDVASSPYSIQIYDNYTGVRLNQCSSGTTCALDLFQTTDSLRNLIAYVTDRSNSAQPVGCPAPTCVAQSPVSTVIWGNGGISVSLKQGQVTPRQFNGTYEVLKGTSVAFTATTGVPIQQRNLFLMWYLFYDDNTESLLDPLRQCSGGPNTSSCSAHFSATPAYVSGPPIQFQAFICDGDIDGTGNSTMPWIPNFNCHEPGEGTASQTLQLKVCGSLPC